MAHRQPITRTTSASSSASGVHTPLSHPTPDLQSFQGAYFRNVMALEQKAEEMSSDGCDIGEEIRKMHEEQKSRENSIRSRQSSIQSSHQGEVNGVRGGAGGAFGRGESVLTRTSSSGQNIVDVNGAARWGGYSPTGYVGSPVGSVQSGSWSHASMPRKASATGYSRLAQVAEPAQEGRPLDSPMARSIASHRSREDADSRRPSQSSFSRRYDEIAGQIEDSLIDVPPSPPKHDFPSHEEEIDERGAVTPPQRPRSSDTYQEADVAFKDFDGVHFSPDKEEFVQLDENGNEVRRVSARHSSGGYSLETASMLRTPRPRPISSFVPPPAEGMVYYPAPVPRMLNLPKRLSQLPAASEQAKRRSQVLSQLPPGARQSAPWLSQTDLNKIGLGHRRQTSHGSSAGSYQDHPRGMLNQRMSMNLHNLPPQLRAGVFFDHQSITQDVDIKSESAVATLDSILAASATAPVSAFVDHPYAGDVRKSTYAPERPAARRSTTFAATTAPDTDDMEKKAKRRSSIGNLLRRSTSGNTLGEELKRQSSRNSLLLDFNEGGKKLQKRKSQMSLGDEMDRQAQPVRKPGNEISEPDLLHPGLISQAHNAGFEDEEGEHLASSGTRPASAMSGQRLNDIDQIEDDFREEEAQDDVGEGEPVYTQPTTLLAELQVRKAQLKSRNKTAATAFPNGMHSTLLEMDAVEEITQRKRQGQRTALAWEEPGMHAEGSDEDDDVPLGMLFPAKGGAKNRKTGDDRDWNRPLGLMEKRELEDNEPLASRKNRLQGLPPNHGRAPSPDRRPPGSILPSVSQLHLAGQPDAPPEGREEDEAEAEHEGETLAQRIRRLKTKSVLDTAIGDVAPKTGSRPGSTFADDVLSQFGGLDVKEKKPTADEQPKPADAGAAVEEEEETLGQRRARLQREREASGEQQPPTATRQGLNRSSTSLADLLAANPIGSRKTSREHKLVEGTLLHASAQSQAKQKAQLLNTNTRSTSFYLDKPLVNAGRPRTTAQPLTATPTGLPGQQSAGFLYNKGVMNQPLQTSASTPMFGMNGQNSYFASPTTMLPYGGAAAGMMGGYQHPMMNSLAYQTFTGAGGAHMNPYGMPAYGGFGAAHMAGGMMPYGAMGMGMGMAEEPLDPNQRAAIDQWRLSVAQ